MNKGLNTKFPYSPFRTFCIRTPILSMEFYQELVSKSKISDDELKKHFESPVISEAIYLASPELFEQLSKWFQEIITEDKKVKRLRAALLKYLTRMSTRCTPFGLFAAVGVGFLDKETIIEPKPLTEYDKKAQFDMQYLAAFANYLAKKPEIKKQLQFFPNSSLYKIGGRYRYVEYTFENKQRAYTIESVAHSSYLEGLLESAKKGSTLSSLINQLENQEIGTEEAVAFIDELVENQILVSELEPTVTGDDFLLVIRDKISTLANVDMELKQINKFIDFLEQLNIRPGTPISLYESLMKNIGKLEIPFEKKYLLQVDTFSKYHKNTLSYSHIKKVKECIAFLNKISSHEPQDSLEKFKRDFKKRYEHQKMPLLQILDVETGIGYGQNPTNVEATPFLDDIAYHGGNSSAYHRIQRTYLFKVLQSKLATAFANKKQVIELRDSDFPNSQYNWKNAPNTISVMVELISGKGQDTLFLTRYSEHANKTMGRFGNGNEQLRTLLNEISEKEAHMNKNRILAEVVHLPEARTGNILRRPVLTEFEIPYLGKSNLNDDQRIGLDDLLVSIENGLVVLHSKNLDKPVLPKLSNAHNFRGRGLPTYRFLCDIQYQEQKGCFIEWPSILSSHQFLPRIKYNNCILSKAKWNLKKKQIAPLLENMNDERLLLSKVAEWREEFSIPRLVQLVHGDNTLVVEFKNYDSVYMFLNTVKNHPYFTIEEFLRLQKMESTIAKNDFCAEYVISFYDDIKLKVRAND